MRLTEVSVSMGEGHMYSGAMQTSRDHSSGLRSAGFATADLLISLAPWRTSTGDIPSATERDRCASKGAGEACALRLLE